MSVFLDSGILLRSVHRGDANYPSVRAAIARLARQDAPLFTGLQHLAEFWNVCTRPSSSRGGFGLTIDEAAKRLRRIRRGVHVLVDTPLTPDVWISLVQKQGVQVHDCRTVALMMTHGIRRLLTLNPRDFARYSTDALVPVTPDELIASPR